MWRAKLRMRRNEAAHPNGMRFSVGLMLGTSDVIPRENSGDDRLKGFRVAGGRSNLSILHRNASSSLKHMVTAVASMVTNNFMYNFMSCNFTSFYFMSFSSA